MEWHGRLGGLDCFCIIFQYIKLTFVESIWNEQNFYNYEFYVQNLKLWQVHSIQSSAIVDTVIVKQVHFKYQQ